MTRNAIITCSDSRAGDFLVEHWLASLQANVDLDSIDVIVLDYGLSAAQLESLKAESVLVEPCECDGHPANLRYRDAPRVLAAKAYRNALMCDCADLIFQTDISHLLRPSMTRIHALRERRVGLGGVAAHFGGGKNANAHLRNLQQRFVREPMINAGVMLGPVPAFVDMWAAIADLADHWEDFGTEQLLISEYLLETGYTPLGKHYNFLPWMFPEDVHVREGRILDKKGLIPMVHNAGGREFTRQFARFGFGPDRNRQKWWLAALSRWAARRES